MGESGTNQRKVLIVDDEPSVRESLKLLLKSSFNVNTAENGEQALSIVDEFAPDLILLDVIMPTLDGMETLRQLRERGNPVPVIMLTATTTVKTAVQAMKLGAADYLNKPFDIEDLTSLIVTTLDSLPRERLLGRKEIEARATLPAGDFGPMVGSAPMMTDVFLKIKQVAPRDTTVLITGESGTGKELVAKQIHDLSGRKDGPFIALNCAAIPETLVESELFGHEKGAFTSAIERRIGHFELANGGTLFLDEIGELSLQVQVKLLRFLQEQEFYRVGRSKPIRVNVRIIAATNKTLEELVEEKKFRQDLYYRINVVNIRVPALRDRFEDIPSLVAHFLKKFGPSYEGRGLSFTNEAMEALVQYNWPGNVRELENVIESLLVLSNGEEIVPEALPRKVKAQNAPQTFNISAADSTISFEDAEKRFETEMIVKALKKTNYVQTRAAELLGISRRILKYKMDKLAIKDTPEGASSETRQAEEA